MIETETLRARILIIGLVTVFCILVVAPTFFRSIFSEGKTLAEYWISKPIQLGLDLVGGVYVLYQVDQERFTEQLKNQKVGEIRNLLRKEEVPILDYERVDDQLLLRFVTERSTQKASEVLSKAGFNVKSVNNNQKEVVVELKTDKYEQLLSEATLRAVETIRTRVDQFGVAEPVVQRVGVDRVLVELPGVKDLDRVKSVIGKTARLEFRFLPRGKDARTVKLPMAKSGELVEVEDEVVLTGDTIRKAALELTPSEGPVVAIQFNVEGAREFARITRENIGSNLAIILDGIIYSAPQIQSAITDGNAIITGMRSADEARELAVVLRSGTLPAPLRSIEERVIGPTLGEVYVSRAGWTLVTSFICVTMLMIYFYGRFGIVASISLLVNVLLMVASLCLLQATLTFPGLAAIALTLGIAVDSNIIIFERIKDALREGNKLKESIEKGFSNAYSALVDANITSLITSLLVYFLAHGPIKGFALTFAIGTITTLFAAIYVAKTLIYMGMEKGVIYDGKI